MAMRWDRLFDDLEAQAQAGDQADFEAELVDLIRAERSALSLRERLTADAVQRLRFTLVDGETLGGVVRDAGADWLLLDSGFGDVLLPVNAIAWIGGLGVGAVPDAGRVARTLGLASVLRGLAGDRAGVTIKLRGGLSLTGTIDRVGVDHCDVAVHPLDEPRRASAVSDVHCVPTAAILRIGVA